MAAIAVEPISSGRSLTRFHDADVSDTIAPRGQAGMSIAMPIAHPSTPHNPVAAVADPPVELARLLSARDDASRGSAGPQTVFFWRFIRKNLSNVGVP